MNIDRYKHVGDKMVQHPEGEYVRWEDYEKMAKLCQEMLPVFEAARPLVLTLERLKDAARSIE